MAEIAEMARNYNLGNRFPRFLKNYKVTVPGAVNPAPVVNGGSSGNCGGSIAGSQNGTLLMSLLGFVAIFLLVGIRREA